VATNNSFVLAQPCQAQLGSPNISTQYYYYGDTFQVTVPVSASCSFYAAQFYATGTAYDTTYNANIGTANTVLTSTYGGYGYTGQLTFILPTSAQSHPVQFSVWVYGTQNGYYGGPYGGLLAETSSTFLVGPTYYEGYPSTYPSYPSTYPSYPSYPTTVYPSYPTYPTYPSYPSNYNYNNPWYGPSNGGHFYVAGYNYYHNYIINGHCGSSIYCSHR